MKIIRTPTDAAPYLNGLNTAFGAWGDAPEWNWTFVRTAGAHIAERLVATDDDGVWIAGSGVSWRQVAGVGHVGIMTGSWTLPAARGQGCFSTFIRESSAMVSQSGGVALLSFVTATNPSRRRLEASGAHLVHSVYVRSVEPWSGAPAARLQLESVSQSLVELLWALHTKQTQLGCGFTYPDAASFAGQFIERPQPVAVYRDSDTGDWAIFEHASDTDRLLFVGGQHADPRSNPKTWSGLAAWSGARDRKFFGFAIHPDHRRAAVATDLDIIPGFLCVNAAMADASADPGPGPEVLRGDWALQSGDRM